MVRQHQIFRTPFSPIHPNKFEYGGGEGGGGHPAKTTIYTSRGWPIETHTPLSPSSFAKSLGMEWDKRGQFGRRRKEGEKFLSFFANCWLEYKWKCYCYSGRNHTKLPRERETKNETEKGPFRCWWWHRAKSFLFFFGGLSGTKRRKTAWIIYIRQANIKMLFIWWFFASELGWFASFCGKESEGRWNIFSICWVFCCCWV